jgi:hypothetical protein
MVRRGCKRRCRPTRTPYSNGRAIAYRWTSVCLSRSACVSLHSHRRTLQRDTIIWQRVEIVLLRDLRSAHGDAVVTDQLLSVVRGTCARSLRVGDRFALDTLSIHSENRTSSASGLMRTSLLQSHSHSAWPARFQERGVVI